MADPVDNARRLLVALDSGIAVPPDVAAWAADGLRAYLDGGGARRLCSCLRLAGPGRRRPGTLRRRAYAGQLLRWLVDDVRGDSGASTWSCCQQLAEQVDQFERRHWPRVRDASSCPRDWPVQRVVMWAFFLNTGGNPPRTAKGLYELFTHVK